MKTRKITYAALALCLSACIAACDRTIHQYPVPQDSLVIIEANVDRGHPAYFKEVIYDEEGNRSENDLQPDEAQPYYPSDKLEMRIILDIYSGQASEKSPQRERLCRRILYVENIAGMPQDTIHVWLPDGDYYVLGWADYVLKDSHRGTYITDDLTNIRTDIEAYPRNTHHRSSGAGNNEFEIDFSLTQEGYPVMKSSDEIIESRIIPVDMKRPSGRYRIIAEDYDDFIRQGGQIEGMTVKVTYKQYISSGFNVATMEPNDFVPTYSFDIDPADIEYEGKHEASLFGDYIFTTNGGNTTNIIADFIFYDKDGNEINHCQNIVIPLKRDHETIVRGYFLTREVGSGNIIGIDENFDGEHLIEI